MSQTTITEESTAPDRLEGWPSAKWRTLLTPAEYDQQKRNYTKEQLKNANLYYQHEFHFLVLNAVQKLKSLWTKKTLYASMIVTVLFAIALFSGTDTKLGEGGSLVPSMSFAQRVRSVPFEFLERIKQFTGQTRKGLLLPEEGSASNSSSRNSSRVASERNEEREVKGAPEQTVNVKTQQPPSKKPEGETALVDSTFSSFVRSQTTRGVDIFTFAYSLAQGLAESVFSVFGWSQNATTAASS